MNKTAYKSQLPITYQILSKEQTDNFRHQVIMKSSQNYNSEKSSNKNTSNIYSEGCQQKSIFIKKTSIDKTISVYQWRYKTCYPIVKPIQLRLKSFTGSIQHKSQITSDSNYEIWNLDQSLLEVSVIIQKIQWKLSQIDKLPLPQIIYLFKEALVSFQCLIDIFGLFEPTQNMIVVNSFNEWRFWISEDFTSNSKKQVEILESQFLLKLIKIVESKLIMSKTGSKLFNDLRKLEYKQMNFLNVLNITKKYIQSNKVMVSKKVFIPQTGSSRILLGSQNLIQFNNQGKQSELLQSVKQTYMYYNNKTYDSSSNLGMKVNTSIQDLNKKAKYKNNNEFKNEKIIQTNKNNQSNLSGKCNYIHKNVNTRNTNISFNSILKPQQVSKANMSKQQVSKTSMLKQQASKSNMLKQQLNKTNIVKQVQRQESRQRSKSPVPIKSNNPQLKSNQYFYNNVPCKSPLKISQLYISDLTKNNIEKRASFMIQKKEPLEPQKFKTDTKYCKYNSVIRDIQNLDESPRNPISYTQRLIQNKQYFDINSKRLFSPKPQLKNNVDIVKKDNKVVFDLLEYKTKKRQKNQQNQINHNKDIQTKSAQNFVNKINYQKQKVTKQYCKQTHSQSPTKSNNKLVKEQILNLTKIQDKNIKQGPNTSRARHQNIICREVNRQRKLSQQIPKIKSLDDLAKKSKKMCESTVITAAQQNQKQRLTNYNNLKKNDIQNHSRNNQFSIGFGLTHKQQHTINNDSYNGNFENLINNVKNKEQHQNVISNLKNKQQNQHKNQISLQLNLNSKIQRKKNVFAIIEEQTDRKYSEEKQDELCSPASNNSPFYKSEYMKLDIRFSNMNNQTAETLYQIKGSQNDNSINSASKNQKNITPQNSDYSHQKKQIYINSKGLIGQSNLSIFSCKTQQPVKKKHNNATQKKNNQKPMATSQDFVKNQSSSQNTSEQFLKSNNWNKKISGLFSDVASIKVLRQSGHFGDQTDFFQKDYLKDVKLQKLDKLGKQLKGSIISDDDNGFLNVPYVRPQQNYKSISLIGQVKQDPYENQPSILQHSTSMICQSKHNKDMDHSFVEIQKSMRQCQSFEQQIQEREQIEIQTSQKVKTRNRRVTQYSNGGFSFESQLYNMKQGNRY